MKCILRTHILLTWLFSLENMPIHLILFLAFKSSFFLNFNLAKSYFLSSSFHNNYFKLCGFICIYTPIWWFGELFLLQYVVNLVLMQLMIYLFKYTVLLGFPGGASGKITHLSMQETWEMPGSISWVGKILWRRGWQPTSVFLPGEFHEKRSLAGYSP